MDLHLPAGMTPGALSKTRATYRMMPSPSSPAGVELLPDAHTPRPLPPADDLFEVALWGPASEPHWSTVAWPILRADADTIAAAFLERGTTGSPRSGAAASSSPSTPPEPATTVDAGDRVLLVDLENAVGAVRPRPALVRARVTALRQAAGTVHHVVACYSATDPAADVVVSVHAGVAVCRRSRRLTVATAVMVATTRQAPASPARAAQGTLKGTAV
jgi:hypothetical protein